MEEKLTFADLCARKGVEIVIRADGLVTWLNVDGICRARIITNGFVPIVITDGRIEIAKVTE